jgi:hypothetical protein
MTIRIAMRAAGLVQVRRRHRPCRPLGSRTVAFGEIDSRSWHRDDACGT